MHDDLQVMRLLEMDKCLYDGQVPCRWSPDMVWGFGQPMFNYYSAFPYYLGALLRILLPLTYLGTVKSLFLISFLMGGIGMYKLTKEFWGKSGGLLSAILYTYAPYHALDVYVRGALSEVFALSLLPWMWFFLYKLIRKRSLGGFVGSAVSVSFVLATHNISTMIYAPITLLWCLYWIFVQKKVKTIFNVVFAGLLGLGLASFFIIPATFEQKIIQTQFLTSDYSDYRAHFVTLRQLFINRSWGDGPSIFGDADEISFQIGWPHWWVGLIAVANFCYLLIRKKIDKKTAVLISGLAGFTMLFTFLTHLKSFFIWEKIPQMSFIQFPWRFLGLTFFFLSFVAGSINLSKTLFIRLLIVLTIFLSIVLNFQYFIPVHYSRKVTDEQKLSGVAFELQQKSAIMDYLPKTAQVAPQALAFEKPKIIEGDLNVGNFNKSSDSFSFDVDVYTPASVEVPVMYFPGWKVYVDGREAEIGVHGVHGLIKISLINGQHDVYGKFTNTPVRSFANTLSIISFAILVLLIGLGGRYEEFTKKNVKK